MLLDVVVRAALPQRLRQPCVVWLRRRAQAISGESAGVQEREVLTDRASSNGAHCETTDAPGQPVPDTASPTVPDPDAACLGVEQWSELRLDLMEQQLALLAERVRRSRPVPGSRPSAGEKVGQRTRADAAVRPTPPSPSNQATTVARSEVRPISKQTNAAQGAREKDAPRVASVSAGGPVLAGTLAGLSLGSLLNVLEYEGCSGRLTLSRDHRYLQIVMQGGGIVSAELDGAKVTVVEGVKAVCDWESAGFEFRSEFCIAQPQSGVSPSALMLEIMSGAEARTG